METSQIILRTEATMSICSVNSKDVVSFTLIARYTRHTVELLYH